MSALANAASSNILIFVAVLLVGVFAYAYRKAVGTAGRQTVQESRRFLSGYRTGPGGPIQAFALVFCLAYIWGRWLLLAVLFAGLLFGWLIP